MSVLGVVGSMEDGIVLMEQTMVLNTIWAPLLIWVIMVIALDPKSGKALDTSKVSFHQTSEYFSQAYAKATGGFMWRLQFVKMSGTAREKELGANREGPFMSYEVV